MGFLGALVNSTVKAVGGGLRGQNEGDDKLYERHKAEQAERRSEEHYQNDYLLRKYAAEHQQAQDTEARTHRAHEEQHWLHQDEPEWQRLGYPSQEAWDRSVHRPPLDHDHTDRRPEWQKQNYPSFEAWRTDQLQEHGGGRGNAGENIRNLNTVVDDEDRGVARLEKETPDPWTSEIQGDSASYTANRDKAVARADSARSRRDRFANTRNDLVAQEFGIQPPRSSSNPGRVDSSSLSRGAGHGGRRRPPPVAAGPGAADPAGATQPVATSPQAARMAEINRQYQAGLAWRGPNGERKSPKALLARYQELMAEASGGQ